MASEEYNSAGALFLRRTATYIEVIAMNKKMYTPSKKRGKTVIGKIIAKIPASLSDFSSPSTIAVVFA